LTGYTTVIAEINDLFLDSTAYVGAHGAGRALKRTMFGQLNRVRDVEALSHDTAGDPATASSIEAFSPLMFWFITLMLKRQLFTHFPSEIVYPAEAMLDLLQKQSELPNTVCSPFHHHFLALAVVTLLEATDVPEVSNDAWAALDKALHIVNEREKYAEADGEFEKIFVTQSWESCIRRFIVAKLTKARSGQPSQTGATGTQPLVGPSEQRSLQHLADLAVGAGGNTGGAGSSPPPTSAGDKESDLLPVPDKQQRSGHIDFSLLTKKGYLNILAGTY
jgi:hypothetical protein